ncbi:hypothetical protein [Microcystis phage Mvi-JY20]|uniref:Uncharacterized protein n=1 Tax=Microcystis phage Mvi-JY20 TaxID=3128146 RepID=A0AAX4QFZ3_9CAUD
MNIKFEHVREKLTPGQVNTGVCRLVDDCTIMWWAKPERNGCKTVLNFFDVAGMYMLTAEVSLDKPREWVKGHRHLRPEYHHLFECAEAIVGELATRYSEIDWDTHEHPYKYILTPLTEGTLDYVNKENGYSVWFSTECALYPEAVVRLLLDGCQVFAERRENGSWVIRTKAVPISEASNEKLRALIKEMDRRIEEMTKQHEPKPSGTD